MTGTSGGTVTGAPAGIAAPLTRRDHIGQPR